MTAAGGLSIRGVRHVYGTTVAVDDVSLDVKPGEFLVLLGPSGCGKTTLLRMVAGLLEPTAGRIVLDGLDITDEEPRDRDVAMVFQSYALYPHLTVGRNIGFALRARKVPRAERERRVAEVAATLGLGELLHRLPRDLSGRQRQRVALGRAIVREPAAFLMDEPLSNLDARLRTQTRTELVRLHRRLRATVVYVTHDQVEAMTMATRIALMDGGRLEQVGTPEEVYDRPASTFVAGFVGAPPMNLLDADATSGPDGLRAACPAGAFALPAAGDVPRELTVGVRPEHLRPTTEAGARGAAVMLRATVDVVETLGSDEVAICDAAGVPVAVRGPRPVALRPGQDAVLVADEAHVHLFDRASGRRLERRIAPAALPDPSMEAV